ncbi:hypothetical protein V6N11_079216 [Hibiscus sabdariffa]|uniref:Leucine-rich repeat-containing N-terminal plant-type domain-containing protein n=1 Tax=Hibiscus sabdariffa TaxID=183260 RepID=A0ABR2RUS4_9ROSI
MAKTCFLLPLMFLLLFVTFRATLSVNSPGITTDQSALLVLKSRITHDPHDFLTTNWSSSTSVCNWIGVTCGSIHNRVIVLNLSSMDLTGTIPSQLGNLSFLTSFNIRHNSFHGSIPTEFIKLHRLKYLNFGNNSFSGEIPALFGYFPELQILLLYSNNFTGVIPSALSNLSKLERLSLFNNSIKGPIPSSIFNISSLQVIILGSNNLIGYLYSNVFDYLPGLFYLDLKNCQLSGKIPMSLFKCNELEYLHLGYNNLEGTVPLEISNLTSLKYFNIRGNNFSGQIPSSICNLSFLEVLFLFKNSLDGKIPRCIGNLSSSLLLVDLHKNNFHGKIPENFVEGCSLRSLRINNNQVEGSLPRSLGNCKDLKLFDVGKNKLNDTFPNWLGNLVQLQVLILRLNRFYGQIQVDSSNVIVSFPRLRIIDISHNNFSGCLPMNFFKNLHNMREWYGNKVKPEYMKEVVPDGMVYDVQDLSFTAKGLEIEFEELSTLWTIIDFSKNQFSGEIPQTFGELRSLIVLNLSHNCLTGHIPSSLGDLSELESLDLSSNQLHERIPTELKNLGFLEVLNLSHNNLMGLIPQGRQFYTFTDDSYKGNLGLCGLPLSKICDSDEETPSKFDRDDDELNWKFSILMGQELVRWLVFNRSSLVDPSFGLEFEAISPLRSTSSSPSKSPLFGFIHGYYRLTLFYDLVFRSRMTRNWPDEASKSGAHRVHPGQHHVQKGVDFSSVMYDAKRSTPSSTVSGINPRFKSFLFLHMRSAIISSRTCHACDYLFNYCKH